MTESKERLVVATTAREQFTRLLKATEASKSEDEMQQLYWMLISILQSEAMTIKFPTALTTVIERHRMQNNLSVVAVDVLHSVLRPLATKPGVHLVEMNVQSAKQDKTVAASSILFPVAEFLLDCLDHGKRIGILQDSEAPFHMADVSNQGLNPRGWTLASWFCFMFRTRGLESNESKLLWDYLDDHVRLVGEEGRVDGKVMDVLDVLVMSKQDWLGKKETRLLETVLWPCAERGGTVIVYGDLGDGPNIAVVEGQVLGHYKHMRYSLPQRLL